MNIITAMGTSPPEIVLCGNLDQSAVFCQSTPEEVAAKTDAINALSQQLPFRLMLG